MLTMGIRGHINIIPVLQMTTVAHTPDPLLVWVPFASRQSTSASAKEWYKILCRYSQTQMMPPPFTYHPHAVIGLFVHGIPHVYYVENPL